MSKNRNYPVILGGGSFKKGMVAVQSKLMKGVDLYIVRLKREVPPGSNFELEDVENTEIVLHFVDMEAVQRMAELLNRITEGV